MQFRLASHKMSSAPRCVQDWIQESGVGGDAVYSTVTEYSTGVRGAGGRFTIFRKTNPRPEYLRETLMRKELPLIKGECRATDAVSAAVRRWNRTQAKVCHSHEHVPHLWQAASLLRLCMGSMGSDGPKVGDFNQSSVFYYTANLSRPRDTEKG